jgi:hypothetical protein
MRKTNWVIRLSTFAFLAISVAFSPVSRAQAQTDGSQPSTADLAKRIDDLEKQLADLKSQVAAQPAAAPATAPATAPAAGSAPATAATSAPTAAAPAAPTIASLLGPTTLSGFVDTYYGYNANQPSNRTTALRNFDIDSNQFALNMLELVADKAPDPAASHLGFHIALGFGEAMNLINGTEVASPNVPTSAFPGIKGYATAPPGTITNFDQNLKEAYLEYLIGKKLQINVGKFVTPAGAEVIESKDNWNYSRSLLFSWAIPYFHFGASAKYTFNSKFSLTGYLVNGWNDSVDNNGGKTGGFSAAWTPTAKWSLTENYLGGPEQPSDNTDFRNLTDTVITYTPNAKLSLMANYDYGHDHIPGFLTPGVDSTVWWSGIAGYIKYAPNDKWYIATRGEWFDDHNGAATLVPQEVSEFTLTLQRMLAGKLMSRLEYRYDTSTKDVFADNAGFPKGDQSTLTLGLIYVFSSADAK